MFDHILLRDAQTHLEHAKSLDQDNSVAQVFLDKVRVHRNSEIVIIIPVNVVQNRYLEYKKETKRLKRNRRKN